jgi:2-keto-4-pentenoate hydratase/2-oxohepta-3-ene-1,7-dioic acid hydratase in catechol pathway
MKFASFEQAGQSRWGAVAGDRIHDLGSIAPTLADAITGSLLPESAAGIPSGTTTPAMAGVRLLPPLPDARRIFCIGLNYAAHQEETGRKPTDHPVIFVRFASSVVGHENSLLIPLESEAFDFEGELAAVIGRPGRRIREADALEHVAGYACFMDGSIRDYQRHTPQFTPGKNFDRSGSFGPWLVAAAEVGDPNARLRLQTRLNGQVVQEATTAQMIFPVPALIAYISTFTALQPGDVIATGTPGGVGFTRTPPLFMRPGDRIEVEIEKVGLLANTIEAEPASGPGG